MAPEMLNVFTFQPGAETEIRLPGASEADYRGVSKFFMQITDQLVTLAINSSSSDADNSFAEGELRTSVYCIFVKLPKRPGQVLLVQGYTGAYDEVSLDVAEFLYSRRSKAKPLYGKWTPEFKESREAAPLSADVISELEDRGYLTTLSIDEERERLRSLTGLLHSHETKSLNYILVPSYDCNLRCPYCFQDHMRTDPSFSPRLRRMTSEIVDRIFKGILQLEAEHPDNAPQVRNFTLFGGEPLLAANRDIVQYIVERATSLGPCSFGAITNATDLDHYFDLLGPDAISSLQITLDGPPKTHDLFRVYADGRGSFEKIASNISRVLDLGVDVSVRVNVCKDNLRELPALVSEAKRRGWTAYKNFQIYAAPIQPTNAFSDSNRLLNSYDLGRSLSRMRESDPDMELIETGDDNIRQRALELFRDPEIDPVADFKASYCGAHSGMYIFDPFGDVYACWEKMGDPQIRIGRVDAQGELVLEMPMFSRWRSRTVASNPTCESCSYSLHCGGGCAVLAEARNGKYYSNFCDGFASRFRTAIADAYEAHLTEQENQLDPVCATGNFRSKLGCA